MAGLEMVEPELLAPFRPLNARRIKAMGEKFGHTRHEAMFGVDDPARPAGSVVQQVERGFVLHDRLLRPAKVGVSKGGPKVQPTPADEAGKDGKTEAQSDNRAAYEDKGKEPGAQLDEEL